MYTTRAGRIAGLIDAIRQEVSAELGTESASDLQSGSGEAGLVSMARAVDRMERVAHGLLLQVLGRMDQHRVVPGGVGPWLTSQLGYSPGRGRNVASDARRLGTVPDMEQMLSSGQLPVGAPRMLARAVHATRGTSQDPGQAVTDTLTALEDGGVQQAEAQVRALEHAVEPGRPETLRARQRARSFARLHEVGDGMVRLEALLDAERATLVRSGMDILTSSWLRERQYDHTNPLPDDIQNVEQMNAEALTRFAAAFLNASEAQRAKPYLPGVLYLAPSPELAVVQDPAAEADPALGPAPAPAPTSAVSAPRHTTLARTPIPANCVQTPQGHWISASSIRRRSVAVRLAVTASGDPVTLNGMPLSTDPTARLASPAQRAVLYWRDRHCTHPGCTRPVTWSLHAHHVISYAAGGPTIINNLTYLCPEHHILVHQHGTPDT